MRLWPLSNSAAEMQIHSANDKSREAKAGQIMIEGRGLRRNRLWIAFIGLSSAAARGRRLALRPASRSHMPAASGSVPQTLGEAEETIHR